ncbi:MAG: cupin domain-containing protein [Kofleriaceae bacterium]
MPAEPRYLVRAASLATSEPAVVTHPLNDNSQVVGHALGRMAGLERTGVNLITLAPGRESFAYHAHALEEEWIYILDGVGAAEIDGVEHHVGPGDFMGFPTPGVGHHLRNTGPTELVYLCGGEHRQVEVADFPRHGKRLVRIGDAIDLLDLATAETYGPYPAIPPVA